MQPARRCPGDTDECSRAQSRPLRGRQADDKRYSLCFELSGVPRLGPIASAMEQFVSVIMGEHREL